MKLKGAQIITEVLLEQGVDTIFGYPGGAALDIYDALYEKRDKIQHYLAAHEQGAAHAADGYARATGKTGVVFSTSGPGATNLVTGIATAYLDSIPLVAITANVGRPVTGKDSFQEVYIGGITLPITKHNYVVTKVEDLADTLREAFLIAGSGRKGPVLVDVPKDISVAMCEYTPQPPVKPETLTMIPQAGLEQVAKMLNESKKPLVCFGGGIVSSEASAELLELVKKASLPACHTIMAQGCLRYDEPLNLGMLGMHGNMVANKAVEQCDLLLAIGTRFSDRVALNTQKFAPNAKIVHIDIDPSEICKNVLAYYSVVADVKAVLQGLIPLVKEVADRDWLAEIEGWKAKDYKPPVSDDLLPHNIIQAILDAAGEDAIIATDVGQHQMWSAQYSKRIKPRTFLTSGGLGTMGFGYGAALGAQAADKTRNVVHITGDGSFHMNMNEACTAVSYNLPVVTVILNNNALGMVRQWQRAFYHQHFYQTTPNRKTDYVKVAEGFGLRGYRATTLDELKDALKKAFEGEGPAWIDCVLDSDAKVLPMIPPGKTVEDIVLE
ncbi:MAG: biosynthetic-type acetolactate synthase large subunit [Firmicutes bacterium]|nr:biosynthetic-type acetolactate synthase large subunit [Bacillota bacterium]